MKILINTSNLILGGGVQVALSFLDELRDFGKDEYLVLLSNSISSQLDKNEFPGNFKFFHIDKTPARVFTRRCIIRQFDNIVKLEKPDVVFTVFGPSYWRPKVPHVMGFALPWRINPESKVFKMLSLKGRLKTFLLQSYQRNYIKKDADYYIVETADVKNRLAKYFNIEKNKIQVVSNTYNSVFDSYQVHKKKEDIFTFITISANYLHKNLTILNDVVPILRNRNVVCRFYLTIPKTEFLKKYKNLSDYIINLGPVKIADCPSLYNKADALFLPTLLECFSASYPEAMKMEIPVLTSDLPFAKSICGDAALYFDPLSPIDIADKIQNIIQSPDLRRELVEKGNKQLLKFPCSKERAAHYISICKDVGQLYEV